MFSRRVITGVLCAAAFGAWALGAAAEERRGPVVVELYTSQGCSACPPADEMMHALAARTDVIALALHVDYWDYIGWEDVFARPEHAERQRGFAARVGKSMVYTPQMVIDGTSHVVGNKPLSVTELIMRHAQVPDPVEVRLEREGDALRIRARGTVSGPVDVHLVRFDPERSVHITRGENRGKTISYANIVRDWAVLRRWDGEAPLDMQAQVRGDRPLAVLVQEPDHGPILGAAALR
jgi:hypothetical protein